MFIKRLVMTAGFVAGAPIVFGLVTLTLVYAGIRVIWTEDAK
jgi:hypothetical protein